MARSHRMAFLMAFHLIIDFLLSFLGTHKAFSSLAITQWTWLPSLATLTSSKGTRHMPQMSRLPLCVMYPSVHKNLLSHSAPVHSYTTNHPLDILPMTREYPSPGTLIIDPVSVYVKWRAWTLLQVPIRGNYHLLTYAWVTSRGECVSVSLCVCVSSYWVTDSLSEKTDWVSAVWHLYEVASGKGRKETHKVSG